MYAVSNCDLRQLFRFKLGLDYAASLINLAELCRAIGDYTEAESLLIKARDTFRKTLGENHPSYATSLNNLGELYANRGDNSNPDYS